MGALWRDSLCLVVMELERCWACGLGFQSASREAGAGGSFCLCPRCCQREPLAAVLSAPVRFRSPGLAVGWAAPAQIVTVKSIFNLYVQKMENVHLSPVISKAVPPYQQQAVSPCPGRNTENLSGRINLASSFLVNTCAAQSVQATWQVSWDGWKHLTGQKWSTCPRTISVQGVPCHLSAF